MPSLLGPGQHYHYQPEQDSMFNHVVVVRNNGMTMGTREEKPGNLRELYERWRTGIGLPDLYALPLNRHHHRHSRFPRIIAAETGPRYREPKRRLSDDSLTYPTFATDRHNQLESVSNIIKAQHGTLGRIWVGPGHYDYLAKIGRGSYGNVFKCRHRETGLVVAIKKFIEADDNPSICKVALREIKILKQLHHPNIVTLLEVFRIKRKLHLVFEYCSRTLLEEIQHSQTGLLEKDARIIISQVLQALQVIHGKGFIHRDIKPENILLTGRKTVKLCDFGFARSLDTHRDEDCVDGSGNLYTDYVATRWYRAPELLISQTGYDTAVDIWAVGCVFAECVSYQPLLPGSSDIDQLFLARKLFANPTAESLHAPCQTLLRKKLAKLSRDGIDELQYMMRLEGSERPSADDLSARPYFGLHLSHQSLVSGKHSHSPLHKAVRVQPIGRREDENCPNPFLPDNPSRSTLPVTTVSPLVESNASEKTKHASNTLPRLLVGDR